MDLQSWEEEMGEERKKNIKIYNLKDIRNNEQSRNKMGEWKGHKYMNTPLGKREKEQVS